MKISRGDLIRRKTKDGKPIGPWIQVTQATNYYVYGRPLDMDIEVLLSRKNVYIPTMVKLPLRPLKFYEIKNKLSKCVTHKLSSIYQKILNNAPELILFYDNMDGDNRMFVTVEEVKREELALEIHVRIIIGKILLTLS